MLRYAFTIFLSAFLLFQVQPIIARFVLPWFGGTAAVWTTCMMFFQIVLLIGYAYAHVLRLSFSPRNTWLLHAIVLAVAACFAHIVPSESLRPTGDENLNVAVVTVLAITIGLPFLVLSSTGPLIQAWQSISHRQRSPYRLYALSNLGSMLALGLGFLGPELGEFGSSFRRQFVGGFVKAVARDRHADDDPGKAGQ